jgi:hypothetical protein
MTPGSGLAILEDAKVQATKMFDDKEVRKQIASFIRVKFEEQVEKAQGTGQINETKAKYFLADQQTKMDAFINHGGSKTMGIQVRMPDDISVGHWHCHVTCTLPVNSIALRSGAVNLDDAIAVFQNEV